MYVSVNDKFKNSGSLVKKLALTNREERQFLFHIVRAEKLFNATDKSIASSSLSKRHVAPKDSQLSPEGYRSKGHRLIIHNQPLRIGRHERCEFIAKDWLGKSERCQKFFNNTYRFRKNIFTINFRTWSLQAL